jgi:hypothetical protein
LQVKQWQKNYDSNRANYLQKVTIIPAKRKPSQIGKEQRDENRPVFFPASQNTYFYFRACWERHVNTSAWQLLFTSAALSLITPENVPLKMYHYSGPNIPVSPISSQRKKITGATAASKNSMQIGTLNSKAALPRNLKTHKYSSARTKDATAP